MGSYNLIKSPEKVIAGYGDGSIVGSIRDPAGLEQFLSQSKAPLFEASAWELTGSGAGKISLPFKAAVKLHETFGYNEAQTTGDCVSHAVRNAGFVDHCVDVVSGEVEYGGDIFATENIYGERGHRGQGASCSRLAGYISEDGQGGFLPRKKYSNPNGSGSVDLSVYKSSIGHNWGGSGTPSWLDDLGEDHCAMYVSLVSTLEGARDAIANGYSIAVCSGYGFSNRRDEYGVAARKGGWSHAMAWVGCIDDPTDPAYKKYSGPLFLVQNSWGRFNSGPTTHDQPPGSFWIDYRTARGMLGARGSYAIGATKFKKRDISYLLI